MKDEISHVCGEMGMDKWELDKIETDGYLAHCKAIIQQHTGEEVGVSSLLDDQTLASDLNNERCKVAVRIRNHSVLEDYSDEFTMRFSRPSQVKCEWAKMLASNGPKWMIYGFRPERPGDELAQWSLLDLDVWRAFMREHRSAVPSKHQINRDGTDFICYKFSDLPDNLIAARKE